MRKSEKNIIVGLKAKWKEWKAKKKTRQDDGNWKKIVSFYSNEFRVVYKWKHEEVINHKAGKHFHVKEGEQFERENDQEAFCAQFCIQFSLVDTIRSSS